MIDVVEVLTGTGNSRRYRSDLKRKLAAEGSRLYEKVVQLKLPSSNGKYYKTDIADTEQLLRIIQSTPSPKAEPFKLWLVCERIGMRPVTASGDTVCCLSGIEGTASFRRNARSAPPSAGRESSTA